jgi:undecaprenyl-diphosphatase
MMTLVFSHVAVQLLKRRINRRRPSLRETNTPLVAEPDTFSFPSGHSCAAMAVCFSYAIVFPVLALPLILIAALVGASRVFLGVHYPGDVLVGQLIAIATTLIIR